MNYDSLVMKKKNVVQRSYYVLSRQNADAQEYTYTVTVRIGEI